MGEIIEFPSPEGFKGSGSYIQCVEEDQQKRASEKEALVLTIRQLLSLISQVAQTYPDTRNLIDSVFAKMNNPQS